tara:strand:- start:106 stop:303 length:198 start_codon:yes stop_codon:yes gene_type:complete
VLKQKRLRKFSKSVLKQKRFPRKVQISKSVLKQKRLRKFLKNKSCVKAKTLEENFQKQERISLFA